MQQTDENRQGRQENALHGGDIYSGRPVRLDFSVNTNPLGMPERVWKALTDHPEDWQRYPDPHCRRLSAGLADFYNHLSEGRTGTDLKPEHFICGNGASDLLYSLVFALRPKKALLFTPCFGEYEAALRAGGCEIVYCGLKRGENFRVPVDRLLKESKSFDGVDFLVIGNPNNPTGQAADAEQMELLAAFCRKRGIVLVVDECFQWFLTQPEAYSSLGLLKQYENVFLLNAFTKIFSMAGLRLGYGICRDQAVLAQIRAVRQPWSVSGPAARAGEAALLETEYLLKSRALIKEEREFLEEELLRLGYEVIPSQVNYILFRDPFSGDLAEYCLSDGILIRSCSNFAGLDRSYFRVSVKSREENTALLSCLSGRGKRQEPKD